MKIMNAMKKSTFLPAVAALPALCAAGNPAAADSAAVAAQDRPDIILFMVDDMGWQDTSVPFWKAKTPYNRAYHTPNMERLAASGMKFTQAYACPVSSPTRCSLITGANAARHRVTNWTMARDQSTDIQCDSLTMPEWNVNGVQQTPGIPRSYVGRSFVDDLRDAGYHTIHCGKAHFGAMDTPGEDPHHWGFEVNIAGHAAGGLATYLSEKNYGHNPDGTPYALNAVPGLEKYWGSGTFVTKALTQEALKALDKAAKYAQPYFLYMAHYAIHIPIDRDPRYYQKYLDEGLSEKEAAYASLIEGMDKSLGDIMDWVERNGRADRTIIIFMSDNGGLATDPGWRDGRLYWQNAPLQSGKGSMMEGGIREPLLVRWPGVTKPGSETDGYLMIEDFYPTILEMAGAEHKSDPMKPLDGFSFVPLIKGGEQPGGPEREIVWNFPNIWGNEGPGINLNCALRRGPWKLIYNYATGEKQLYNIPDDISELHNLAKERPEVTRMMSERLGTLLRERGAQRPTVTTTGRPCPWPDEI